MFFVFNKAETDAVKLTGLRDKLEHHEKVVENLRDTEPVMLNEVEEEGQVLEMTQKEGHEDSVSTSSLFSTGNGEKEKTLIGVTKLSTLPTPEKENDFAV